MKNKKSLIIIQTASIILAFLSLFEFVRVPPIHASNIETILALLNNKINESSQILLVTKSNPSSFTAEIYILVKQDDKWEKSWEPINGVIGKNGFAKLGEKREGDGKSPSGIFPLRQTFGYGESAATKMPYRQALSDDVWIDDVDAVDYNRWVKKAVTRAASYELMKRDDDLYKYGIVIEYNTSPVIKGYGSAIFFHIRASGKKPTAGCVAVAEKDIIKILEWLDPAAKPLIIMGTEETIRRLLQ